MKIVKGSIFQCKEHIHLYFLKRFSASVLHKDFFDNKSEMLLQDIKRVLHAKNCKKFIGIFCSISYKAGLAQMWWSGPDSSWPNK